MTVKAAKIDSNFPLYVTLHGLQYYIADQTTHLEAPISFVIDMPASMPSKSITAICASPFAVISPILSGKRGW